MTILIRALSSPNASLRLRAALTTGTAPDSTQIGPLVDRPGTEPDFFARDMLTWALTRHSKKEPLTALLSQLRSDNPQARSQTLHMLSKIGDQTAYASISTDLPARHRTTPSPAPLGAQPQALFPKGRKQPSEKRSSQNSADGTKNHTQPQPRLDETGGDGTPTARTRLPGRRDTGARPRHPRPAR